MQRSKEQEAGARDGGGVSLQGRGGGGVRPRLRARHRAFHALPVAGRSSCTGDARPRYRDGHGAFGRSALSAVGHTGHVTAADVSPAMAAKARERLGKAPNASVFVEDGQALSFADSSFDAVLCNLGLMFFPDPVRGLSEFRRVLRPGGRVAVSVNTVVERSYNHQINVTVARYVPSLAEAVARTLMLGEAALLRSLFAEAGLADVETDTVRHTFVLPSFDAYYGPFERGGASTGQALATLPEEIRRAVREEVRRDLADSGGPVEAEAEYRIASARK